MQVTTLGDRERVPASRHAGAQTPLPVWYFSFAVFSVVMFLTIAGEGVSPRRWSG